ncbi:MAG TPA: thioredoxin domain-containing protein [Bryobacteraceae bacterium]|nr:thioredoxin domain-containing protein [Bryobacteraceae bacterium]
MIGFLGLGFSRVGSAQPANQTKELEDEILALKKQMNALQEKQGQILDSINDLKRLLRLAPGRSPLLQTPATVTLTGELFRGAAAARVGIVEYSDFECPFCGQYMRVSYPQILAEYIRTGKIKYFYRDFPLPIHPHAIMAARAARCAGDQDKFWEMHDSLFSNQTALAEREILDRAPSLGLDAPKFAECLSSRRYADDIQKSTSDAQKMGILGTPIFILGVLNGDVMDVKKTILGARPYEAFKSVIDELLASTNPAPGASKR